MTPLEIPAWIPFAARALKRSSSVDVEFRVIVLTAVLLSL